MLHVVTRSSVNPTPQPGYLLAGGAIVKCHCDEACLGGHFSLCGEGSYFALSLMLGFILVMSRETIVCKV